MRLPAEKMEQHLLSPAKNENIAPYPSRASLQQAELKEKNGTH
jgi:hypothetical protein